MRSSWLIHTASIQRRCCVISLTRSSYFGLDLVRLLLKDAKSRDELNLPIDFWGGSFKKRAIEPSRSMNDQSRLRAATRFGVTCRALPHKSSRSLDLVRPIRRLMLCNAAFPKAVYGRVWRGSDLQADPGGFRACGSHLVEGSVEIRISPCLGQRRMEIWTWRETQ